MQAFIEEDEFDLGYSNAPITLSGAQLLENINLVQQENRIPLSRELFDSLGACQLDIEMETGTGKTYVYIKTMFELNARFGWSKFIVVVPSVAIREGIKKSFEMTEDHFMEQFGKKARYFIYNSSNLSALDNFSSSADINVMIINMQAFNARDAAARRINEERDDFGSRRPIDVIAANRPILILDEPQRMGGEATQEGLARFNPLFSLYYSATHRNQHNPVYVLDALDAYNQRLVKRIEVKGFEVKNLRGTDGYLYLDEIRVSTDKPPQAKIELEVNQLSGIARKTRWVSRGDDLYVTSGELEQYREGFVISDIVVHKNSDERDYVEFTNGERLYRAEVLGDPSGDTMRRIQIRETIASHFAKERDNFKRGIKTLSLFFIDKVKKYRLYDEEGKAYGGEYAQVFEEEYARMLEETLADASDDYAQYLRQFEPDTVHAGYFSIDKKGRSVDSKIKRGSTEADDIDAYDLILKNKERLLSFEEPVRFIFSHSALREGWDNPNVFQICTLKHSESEPNKRQEVGRGLRLSVNSVGTRMDKETTQFVHDINVLTVVASESYRTFVDGLQNEIRSELADRPRYADEDYFRDKRIPGTTPPVTIDVRQARSIYQYLARELYINEDNEITSKYRSDVELGILEPLPEALVEYSEGIHKLIQSVYDPSILDDMISDGTSTRVTRNDLNENFEREDFQALWNMINHKYAYTVSFDSEQLIEKAVPHLDQEMSVAQVRYATTTGAQRATMTHDDLQSRTSFSSTTATEAVLAGMESSQVPYDLIGKVAEGTTLTRKTVATILSRIKPETFTLFTVNPEEFINQAIKLIKDQKATMIVEHIEYNLTDQRYDASVFTDAAVGDFSRAIQGKKSVQDYVFTDGIAEDSVEKRFVEDLEQGTEVAVYAKLPKGFAIPTPVGNYTPDWAIVFHAGDVKHIYFVAETKGSLDSLQLRPVEQAKIDCARKLFSQVSDGKVAYHTVADYSDLMDIVKG